MKKYTNRFLYGLIAVLVIAFAIVMLSDGKKPDNVNLSQVINEASAGKIDKIQVTGDQLLVFLKDGTQQQAFKEQGSSLAQYGIDYKKVTIDPRNPDSNSSQYIAILESLLPILIIIGFFYFMMRQAQGSSNQAMSLGKSKARLFVSEKEKVTFRDVAGSEEAKQELTEIVEFLKYPQKFEALGAKIPKGVLLYGAPGTGKTLLARAVAGEAGVPFFSISGSEFVEMFVGVGASRVRDLFARAKKNSPCIIFIDEIDAVGRQRGAGMGGGHDEREQTLNQILVEMDGFEKGTNVIVMAATNRPDVLDPALLRPGRFDRRVTLDLPDRPNRKAILGVHMEGKPAAADVNLDEIAAKTPGFSGADLANLANEAAILTARHNLKKVSMKQLHEAVEKVTMGPERKSHIMNEREKEITAYHEAGHALVGHILPNTNPIHKVSIVARGKAGGVTWSLPTEDRYLHSIADFKDDLAMTLGGRMAEKIIYGETNVTTGASNDLQHASGVARDMVMEYGMSDRLKNQVFGSGDHSVFLGRDFSEVKEYSEEVASVIDAEVAKLINEASARAEEVILQHRPMLEKIAKRLVKEETIEGPAFEAMFKDGGDSDKSDTTPDQPKATPAAEAKPDTNTPPTLGTKPATA